MESWAAPRIPALPGRGHPLRLHDTATGELIATPAGDPALMYVCGITPYDATHLGHAATYLAFDLVNRVWRDAGHQVHYVQNVTDVDDPLLERAAATGQDWQEVALRETELYRGDMTAMRILPPDEYIGAVESIPLVIELVEKLRADGHAYQVDGDLYFSVHADPRFGSVSGLDAEQMLSLFAERGGDPDRPGKRDPLDCLLWQAARPGEPSWPSSLGEGRPGWHIECAAIVLRYLGMRFDVQGGGRDLVFPHHEMSASEAHVVTGEWPYARSYVHAGMVALRGEKMSKSKGNLVFVSRLRAAGVDPMAIRLALLAHHYRSDWEWTDADLTAAQARLATWRAAASSGFPSSQAPSASGAAAGDLVDELRRHLADDLDTPAALAVIDRWADQGAETATDLVRDAVDALLGVAL